MRVIVLCSAAVAARVSAGAAAGDEGRQSGRNHSEVRRQGSRVRQGARTTTPTGRAVKIQELDAGGERPAASGKWSPTSSSRPKASARRKWSTRPCRPLQHLLLTPEDEQDLRNVQPFVLTTDRDPGIRHPATWARQRSTRSAATVSR